MLIKAFDNQRITKNDHNKYANKVGGSFTMKNLGDYPDLNLMSCKLLLANKLEKFCDSLQNLYGLDPAQIYTALGLTWQAPQKVNIKIE